MKPFLCSIIIYGILRFTHGAFWSKDGSRTRDIEGNIMVFFLSCDGDKSDTVTLTELHDCVNDIKTHSIRMGANPPKLMSIIDTDSDEMITRDEYREFLVKTSGVENAIHFTDRYGKESSMTPDELFHRMEGGSSSSPETDNIYEDPVTGIQTQENSGNSTLSDLPTTDPGMSRFIAVGRWALDELQQNGLAVGKLSQLRSLPTGGSVNRGKELENGGVDGTSTHTSEQEQKPDDISDPQTQKFQSREMWLELSVKDSEGKLSFYEVHIEMDPGVYRRPHLALRQAWKLRKNGVRSKVLKGLPPISSYKMDPQRLKDKHRETKAYILAVSVFSCFSICFLAVIIACVRWLSRWYWGIPYFEDGDDEGNDEGNDKCVNQCDTLPLDNVGKSHEQHDGETKKGR